jgi:hypothetical protein
MAAMPQYQQFLRPPRRRDIILALLARPRGATLAELIEATGKTAAYVRAAISVLRESGLEIVCTMAKPSSRYTIEGRN